MSDVVRRLKVRCGEATESPMFDRNGEELSPVGLDRLLPPRRGKERHNGSGTVDE